MDSYPLPKLEDLIVSLIGVKKFSKLDLSSANQQMPLQEGSRKYTTINAHCGMYQYTRLPFSVLSTPGISQKAMDEILQGLPNVICYLDDILVTGASDQEHLHNLKKVLARLRQNGICLKQTKCTLCKNPSHT